MGGTGKNGDSGDTALVWFRRDLRDYDHAALHHARRFARVYCVFIFDTDVLHDLPRADRRVVFIRDSLVELDAALTRQGGGHGGGGVGGLIVRHGSAREEIPALAVELRASTVLANHDYEPQAIRRDDAVRGALGAAGIGFDTFKDQVVFEKNEILSAAGTPYSVFTPYRNAWLKTLDAAAVEGFPEASLGAKLAPPPARGVPTLEEIGFDAVRDPLPAGMSNAKRLWTKFQDRMASYKRTRDFPALEGGSGLSVHLRFGTLSVRELVRSALGIGNEGARAWLDELVWREFYQQVLWQRPDVVSRSYRPQFDAVRWEEGAGADEAFAAWREARTGYPLVDAAMRQLNETGAMHNRLRMVSASFLTKDLGLHWLRGERYFAAKLNDYDLAANNGGWQWAASTGCDAQPWFRIFNPVTQSRKFDPQGRFIRKYLPELEHFPDEALHEPWRQALPGNYPPPIVDHAQARRRTLARFEAARVRMLR